MKRLLVMFVLFPRALEAAPEIEVGMRYLTALVKEENRFQGGRLAASTANGFAATAAVFWSDRTAMQVSATFIQPVVILFPASGGDIDLGTLGLDWVSMTARLYRPARIAPFVGAGAAIVVPGSLDDRFSEDIEIDFDRETTWVAEGGVRFRHTEAIAFDLTLAYMPLEMSPRVRRNTGGATLPATFRLDPLVVAGSVSWRF